MRVVCFVLLSHVGMCLLKMAYGRSTSSFLANAPGWKWKMVGYLDMTDPTQQCPDSWQKIPSPRLSCGKKSAAPCDSLNISTSGASYQTVCGRFRGYQVGSTDGFNNHTSGTIETYYVDGVTVTYGLPASRHHVYTYAAGFRETNGEDSCPCAAGKAPPLFVGSDYYCESGNPGPWFDGTQLFSSDVLWDRQQCGGGESTCCDPPDLPWFCKTFPNPISEDLEVRICTDEPLSNENLAIESFELYIQVAIPFMNIQAVAVLDSDNILHQLEISWIPVRNTETTYTVRVVSADSSVGQGCTLCTTSPCLYIHQITRVAVNYNISVTTIYGNGTLGSQNSTTFGPTNSVFKNISSFNYSSKFIGCSFLNNQSFYCVVCCSTDSSVPPDSSVYNISTTRGTEVTVSLKGLISGQIYYCKAAATNTNSNNCSGPVVGAVKMYFSIVADLPTIIHPTALAIPFMNIQAVAVLDPDNILHQLEISWIPVRNTETTYTVRVVSADSSVGQGCTLCTTSPCLHIHQITRVAVNYNISVTTIYGDGTLGSQNSTTFGPTNSVFKNISSLNYSSNFIGCSFLNNQSFYCVVCCSTDPSVPPDSSVYNISTTRGTEVTVSLQGLTSGQIYYCKAAATNTNSNNCSVPVVGAVKMYFSIVADLPSIIHPTAPNVTSIDMNTIIGITIAISFVVFFSLGMLMGTCIGCCTVKKRSKVTLHHPDLDPCYEMIHNTHQKKITAIEVDPNSAYGTAK